METKDARKLSQSAQEAIRKLAVKAVLEGKTQVEVARMFCVSIKAVNIWVKAYREGGLAALAAKKRGPRHISRLLPWQAGQIAWTIKDNCPDQLKFPFHLWTRESVAALIEYRFGIRLSRWTVGRYLKRWGFTPQKPLKRAYERNPAAVQTWLTSRDRSGR